MYINRSPENDTRAFTRIIKEEVVKEIVDEFWARQNYGLLPEENRGEEYGGGEKWIGEERTALPRWGCEPAGDRRKGILYGLGMVALLGVLLPSYGGKIRTMFNRTALEGVELVDKARSVVARAREDIEDLMAEAGLNELLKNRK